MNDCLKYSEGEVAQRLTEACHRQLEVLHRLLGIHDESLGPLSEINGDESDSSLRLRKVYCHVAAITGWAVDEWSIHSMAPDMRAAFEQLRPLVWGAIYSELHKIRNVSNISRDFDQWDEKLAPFTHPTASFLVMVPEANGDKVRSLFLLCELLHSLLRSYGIALDVEMDNIEEGKTPIHDMVVHATPWAEVEIVGRYFRSG
ncbi:MAG: hypothetical protein OXE17_00080 [Chloroflexi bacterium]|nr:hypothetical protein [Chloroflexota bacterium]